MYKPLIISVCEVNSKNRTQRSEVEYSIPDYAMYSVNLNLSKSRGIVNIREEELSNSVLQILSPINFEEACILEIKLRRGDTLLFCCSYRSPTPSETSDENNCKLLELIQSVSKKCYSHCCIVGDFNMKSIDWKRWKCDTGENSYENRFLESVNQCFLFQHVEHVTRQRGSDQPSLLDLVLTNKMDQISEINYESPLGKSDHSDIDF